MNGQSLVSAFVKIPGGGRAVYTSTGLTYYRHADHLGSSRLATKTTQGARWYQSAYAPYGEDYAHAGDHPDLAFTDENQDTVAGGFGANLYDFMLREYRTGQGRWTSPDPAGLGAVDPTNPQTWNRYAYVVNNPLSYVDLLGDDYCAGYYGNRQPTNSDWCGEVGGTWVQVGGPLTCTPGGASDCSPPGSANPGCPNCSGGGGQSGGGSNGTPSQPSPQKPLTLKEKQCLSNAQQDYNTAISRARQDANHTWWVDIRNAVGGAATGGCIAGAIGAEGIGCLPGGAIGALSGALFGVPGGLWDASNQLDTAVARAQTDFRTAQERCFE